MIQKMNCKKLMWWVAKFHSISSTAWPKPDEPALAGASVFIGTTLFKTLENGLPLIDEAIDESGCKNEVESFWAAFKSLFFAVSKQNRNERSEQVDFAINLLYLASGIFYYRLEEFSFTQPDLDKDFIRIEPFEELLKLCHWSGKAENVESVFDSLASQMMSCARDLHE